MDNKSQLEKYVLGFAAEKLQFILGKKVFSTYRFGTKYNYMQVGDLIKIQDSATQKFVGEAKILKTTLMTFKDLPLTSEIHMPYSEKEEQRRILSGFYSFLNRPIKDDDQFLVFELEWIEK